MATMPLQEVTRRLTLIADERGVQDLIGKFQNLEKAFSQNGATIKATERQFANYERQISTVAKAQQELEKFAGMAFKAMAAGAADATRAEAMLTMAIEKHNAVLAQNKSISEQQTEAISRQKQAYIEEGKAIRDAAAAQDHFNKVLGVSSGGASSSNNQSIANQMRDRIAATEAEIKARAAAAEAAQRTVAASQSRYGDPFRSGLSGKNAADSASVFAADFDAIEKRNKALLDEGRATRIAAEAQEYYNRLLGVSTSNNQGAEIASQMRQRIADTEAEIARRSSAAAAAAQNSGASQNAFAAQFRQGLSGKSASDSASVFTSELDKMRAKYSPLYRAQQEYLAQLREVRNAHNLGAISAGEFQDALARVKTEFTRVVTQEVQGGRLDALGRKPGDRLSMHQARNLGYQVNDVLTGLASGQSLGMIAGQQGGQIYQILSDGPGGAGGSIKRLGGYLKDILTPMRLVVAGFTGIGVAAVMAFNDAANRMIVMQQALNGIGALSGQNIGSLNGIANSSAGAGRISIANSQSLAGGYANAGLNGAQIGTMIGSTRDFAKAFGLDLAEAGKELAQAFRDPMKGAEDLNRRFGTLNDSTFEAIRRAQEQGDANRAQGILIRAYSDAMQQVTVRTNVLSEAFEKTKNVLSDMWTRLGSALSARTPQEDLEAAMAAPRRSGEMSRRMRQNLAMRGRDPDADSGQVETNRLNSVMEAWRKAMESAGKTLLGQREAERAQLSRVAGGYVREITPWEDAAKKFQDRITAIGQALETGALKGDDVNRAREALERYSNSLRMVLNPMQQIQLQSALQLQQTLALTLAQRAAVDAQRAYTQAISEGKTRAEAVAAAEASINQARAEGLRAAQEALMDARKQSALAGLLPDERLRMENQIRMQDLKRQTEVGASGDLPSVFVPFKLGLDLATAALKDFTSALGSKTAGQSASIPDEAWRAQVKFSERAGSMFNPNPAPITPFNGGILGKMPGVILSPEINGIEDLARAMGGRRLAAPEPVSTYKPAQTPAGGLAVDPRETGRIRQQVAAEYDNARAKEINLRYIKQTDLATDALNATLDSQIRNFGRSTAEVAAAAKQQELLNTAAREGVPITEELTNSIKKSSAAWGEAAARQEKVRESLQLMGDIKSTVSDFGSSLAGAFIRGERGAKLLNSGLQSLLSSLTKMSMNLLMKGLFGNSDFSGGLFSDVMKGLLPSANGNVFAGGNVVPFARGGIVSKPTIFPMANGAGLMGEAGPEAIMPLRRGADGRLGVSAQHSTSGGVSIVVNNNARADVAVNESKGPDGSRVIEMMIDEKVGAALASGRHDQAMRGRYGVAARKVQRA